MLCVGAAGLWAGPWRSSRPRWMWPLTKRWRLNSPTRSCWNANTASTRYKSTPNPCSRSKTSRWVSAAAQRNTKLRLEVCSRVKCWRCRSQVDVYIKEKEGINLLQVKGSLSSSGLNDTITKTLADKEVRRATTLIWTVMRLIRFTKVRS